MCAATACDNALTRSISTLNAQYCLSSWSLTTQATGPGIGSASLGNGGSIPGKRASTGDSMQSALTDTLYIGMTRQVLRGGIDARRIWDPGGEEARFLLAVGSGGQGKEIQEDGAHWRRVSWRSLPGGKHLCFEVPVEPRRRVAVMLSLAVCIT